MRWTDQLTLRVRSLLRRQRVEQELDAELRFHLDQQIEENLAAGMSLEEARAAAWRSVGNLTFLKEQCRESLGIRLFDELKQDVRHALRSFVRNPAFTIVAVLTLALGIGANAAIFSAVNAVLVKPLPFRNPDQLVNILETDLNNRSILGPVSAGNFVDWKDRAPAFEEIAPWRFEYFNLTGRDEPERVQGLRVSASFLPMLGARTQLGRPFLTEEEQRGHEKVVVVSDALWHRRFARDSTVVGQKVNIEGEPYTVVGILAPDFHFFDVLDRPIDIYVPLTFDVGPLDRRSHNLNVYARLNSGVSRDQAQSQMDGLYRRFGQAYPQTNATLGARVISLPEAFTHNSRPVLFLLLSAVGLVLFIACANIANLILARATVRQREMALRTALGAGRARLVRQMLTESLLLALLGGMAGILAAVWGVHVLNNLIPTTVVNRIQDFELDVRVLTFSFAISLLCGLVFGMVPALQSSRVPLNETLKEAARSSTAGTHTRRMGRLFVIAEVALAVVLASGALLLIRSALLLQGMPRGLNLHNVLTMQIWLPHAKYPDGRQVGRFYHDVLQHIERVPGVESASVINFPPLAVQSSGVAFSIDGRAPAEPGERLVARYAVIDPRYFRTMNIPLLSGRAFTDSDADEVHGVAIISASMARRFWPNEDPIGRHIRPQFPQQKDFWVAESQNLPLTIVGVVGDVREEGPVLQGRNDALLYLPYLQNPSSLMHLLVRTPSDPLQWVNAVRRQVWAVDKDQPVFDVKTMDDVAAGTFGQSRVLGELTGSFATAALLLAAVGIYGLLSYVVSQRTHEIGIRTALGAQPHHILQAILSEGVKLGLVGVGMGLVASLGLTRLIASLLFGVGATDPLTFAGVALLLLAVTLAACYVPARRATSVDPFVALRCD